MLFPITLQLLRFRLLPRARFYSAFVPLSRAGDKIADVSRPCNCGQHRRIISTSLSGLVPLLPTCFQLLPICTGKITSQFGNSILLNFRQVVKGIGLSISALFPDDFLRKKLFVFYRSAVFRPTGLPCFRQRAVLYTPNNPCQGILWPISNIGLKLSDILSFFTGTSLTVAPSFLK